MKIGQKGEKIERGRFCHKKLGGFMVENHWKDAGCSEREGSQTLWNEI